MGPKRFIWVRRRALLVVLLSVLIVVFVTGASTKLNQARAIVHHWTLLADQSNDCGGG